MVRNVLFLLALFCAFPTVAQIRINAWVEHVTPWSQDMDGTITLTVTGGTPTYSYSWLPGGHTQKDVSQITSGLYQVKVKDATGDSTLYNYEIGYKTGWFNFYGSKIRNDSIIYDGVSSSPQRTALSKNTLLSYSDGWVQMVTPAFVSPYVVGLLDSASTSNPSSHEDTDFAWHVTTGGALYAWYAGYWTYLGTAYTGDVMKIERKGGTFSLRKNGTSIFTGTALAHRKLKVKAQINNSPIANIGVSFQDTVSLYRLTSLSSIVEHIIPNTSDTAGEIKPQMADGYPPYTFKWQPGNMSTDKLINAAATTYSLKVKDFAGDSVQYTYKLAYKTEWSNFYGTLFRNDTIMHDGVSTATNKTALSKNTLLSNTDGWVQMVTPKFSTPYVVGLLDSAFASSTNTHNDNDIAWHVTTGGALYSWYGGYFTYLGTANTGDVMRIERTGTTYYIKKNNLKVFTGTANTKKLKVKAQINNSPLAYIGTSFKDTVTLNRLNAVNAWVDHCNLFGADTTGSISLKISNGSPPYTYSWTPFGGTSNSLTNRGKRQYMIKIKDSAGDSVIYNYRVANKINWMNFHGTLSRNDSLLSDGTGSYVNRTAISTNKLPSNTNGQIELVVQSFASPYLIGFLDTALAANAGDHYDIDFAFHLTTGNALYAWSGGYFSYLGSASVGDVITVERSGSTFLLKRNNVTVHSAAATASQNLRIKGLIGSTAIARLGASFSMPMSINAISNQTHYAVLKKKLDAGYYNTIPNQSSNQTFYFMFDEEYYNPNTSNLSYTIVDNNNSSAYSVPNLIRKIGDNRFALDVTNISPALTSNNYYRIYVKNEKNEVWQARFKVN